MLILGLIKTDDPASLIDPKMFRSVEEMFGYVTRILNPGDFQLSEELSLEKLREELEAGVPLQINFGEYPVALLMGEEKVIQENTDRFIHAGLLDEFLNEYGKSD